MAEKQTHPRLPASISNPNWAGFHTITSLLILTLNLFFYPASVSAQSLRLLSSPLFAGSTLSQLEGNQPEGSEEIPEAYTLGAGDRITITIFGAPEYSGEVLVLSDGSLNLPTAGNVYVEGMTLQEAAAAISAQYRPFIRRPSVTVSLAALRPVRVAIAGEVNRPGFIICLLRRSQSFQT